MSLTRRKFSRTAQAIASAQMSVWEASIVNGQVTQGEVLWTGTGSEVIGKKGRLFRQKYADFIAMVHPEDRKQFTRASRQRLGSCPNTSWSFG